MSDQEKNSTIAPVIEEDADIRTDNNGTTTSSMIMSFVSRVIVLFIATFGLIFSLATFVIHLLILFNPPAADVCGLPSMVYLFGTIFFGVLAAICFSIMARMLWNGRKSILNRFARFLVMIVFVLVMAVLVWCVGVFLFFLIYIIF